MNLSGMAIAALWICESTSPVKPDFEYERDFYKVDPRPAPGTSCFLKTLVNETRVKSATWTVSGLGVFEAYVNGVAVGSPDPDRPRLKPGFTDVRKTRHSFSFDVTSLFSTAAGATNVLAAEVSSGWWRDRIVRFWGRRSAFYGELRIVNADGSETIVGTDTTWLSGDASPVRLAGIFDGEDFDARISRSWMKTGIAPSFRPAVVSTEFAGMPVPLEGPWIRGREDLLLHPVRMYAYSGVVGAAEDRFGSVANVREGRLEEPFALQEGETLVVDFGQNCAGVPRFRFSAAPGVSVRILPREMLNDADGVKDRGNDGPQGSVYLSNVRGARAEANYVFASDGSERYEPVFTYFGCRYLSVTATGRVLVESVSMLPVTSLSSDAEGGCFETEDDAVNRLVANIRWGMRSNYLGVPTDCPQRNERLGWAADTQVFAPTATRLADVDGFLSKWMHDMRDAQLPSGSYASIAPFSQYDEDPDRFGWADAGIIVPHVLWQRYGDLDVVRANWDSMKRMMARVSDTRHELQPGSFQFADWLSFEKYEPSRHSRAERCNPSPECRAYWNYLGACHWLHDALLMSEMAAAIGEKADAERFRREYDDALATVRKTYLTEDGDLLPAFADLQGANVFAIVHDILPDASALARAKARLLNNINAHGGCLQTGFLSTSILMQALDKVDASDVAVSILLNHRFPGWLYSVDQGATTIWERWNGYTKTDGFGPVGMNSFNHYAYGAVAEWMYSTLAGIRPDPKNPGYRHFFLAPRPDSRLGHVRAVQMTPVGKISSAWRYCSDGTFRWIYSVPKGATATVVAPDGRRVERTAGEYEYVMRAGTNSMTQEKGR